MNFQNIFWRLESIHQRTLIRILYEFFFLQDPLPLEQCVICCEQDWDDCFEIQEFINKETFVFKVSGMIYISTCIPINE